jgi:hypothetical protein
VLLARIRLPLRECSRRPLQVSVTELPAGDAAEGWTHRCVYDSKTAFEKHVRSAHKWVCPACDTFNHVRAVRESLVH